MELIGNAAGFTPRRLSIESLRLHANTNPSFLSVTYLRGLLITSGTIDYKICLSALDLPLLSKYSGGACFNSSSSSECYTALKTYLDCLCRDVIVIFILSSLDFCETSRTFGLSYVVLSCANTVFLMFLT